MELEWAVTFTKGKKRVYQPSIEANGKGLKGTMNLAVIGKLAAR